MSLFFGYGQQHGVKHIGYWLVACVLVMCVGLQGALAAPDKESIRIQGVQYDAARHGVTLTAQPSVAFTNDYHVIKLTGPDRVIVDIPNAILSTNERSLAINQDGLLRAELTQSLGTFYQIARLTIYGESPGALENVKIVPKNNQLGIVLPENPQFQEELGAPPLPAQGHVMSRPHMGLHRNVITDVSLTESGLTVHAEPENTLLVKNQFTLQGPRRLVIDLANAVLTNKQLAKTMPVSSGAVQAYRIGQFDEETVRIVVETTQPNTINLSYPGQDKSTLIVSPYEVQPIRTLPSAYQVVGFIEDIRLEKREQATIIRVKTTEPMVRRVVRNGKVIEIHFTNIAARPAFVAYDKQEFPNIEEIQLSPLSAREPNTKMSIRLKSPEALMDSFISLDGQSMEVALTPTDAPFESIVKEGEVPPFQVPKLPKGKYTVVVDAGHGGKDKGAHRNGIYEKHINLSVALKLKKTLEEMGIKVRMTRTTDKFLPLSRITGITNSIKPHAFVSVHSNASVNPALNGIETYYYRSQSKLLAQKIHRRMINRVKAPDKGVRRARFYVINHTPVPAVLCEIGYLSNSRERAQLVTEKRQWETAQAIAEGLADFLKQRYK